MSLIYARRHLTSALLVSVVFTSLIFGQASPAVAQLSGVEDSIRQNVTVATIKETTTALSADDMQGRGTGQPGGDKAANWIADKFKSLGMSPAGDKGSYLQKVDFKETVIEETSFKVGEESLSFGTDYALVPENNGNKDVSGSLVFVSYGIQTDQNNIDMLKGVDLGGKVVILTQGPPPGFPQKDWDKQKWGQSIRRNIFLQRPAAILSIGDGRDSEHSPEESINYMSRRQLSLPDERGYPEGFPPIIYVSSKGAEKLFASAGTTLKDALAKGGTREFKAMDLKTKVRIIAKYKTAKVTSNNVVGYIEGSDPTLKEEAVLFSAHYDAYGAENGKIYHGAADNALGVGEMMAVAEAFSKMQQKPKRSLVFLAVTGEEYGLYGSKHWAKSPTWEIKKVAADLNLDGIGSEVYGPVKTMVGYGAEYSTLGGMLSDLAKSMSLNVIPDPMPDENVFYRSDHYSFVERGVPSLMLLGAPDGDKQIWIDKIKAWEKTDYHSPGDTIKDNWVWEGPETVAEVMGILGWRVSEMSGMPSWIESSRFGKLQRGNSKELPPEP
jgi:hypothetical protein